MFVCLRLKAITTTAVENMAWPVSQNWSKAIKEEVNMFNYVYNCLE